MADVQDEINTIDVFGGNTIVATHQVELEISKPQLTMLLAQSKTESRVDDATGYNAARVNLAAGPIEV